MGDIKIGNSSITLKLGSSDVTAAYIGSTLVYSGGTPPTPTFSGKWLATYSDSSTASAECDSSSAITQNEITLTDLVSVEIGNCVTNIGQSTFQDCSSLTSIDIPNSVTSLGNGAFYSCGSLTSIDIPSGVTSIGDEAFTDCISLTSCTIGSSVTSIGDNAFMYCDGLTSLTVNATTPPTLGFFAFFSTNECPIYVPAGSVNAYKAASGWSSYANRIEPIPNS